MNTAIRLHTHDGVNSDGYRRVWVDGKVALEHRVVMAEVLGRSLYADEHVHHRNGDRLDNRPSNLELWRTKGHRPGQRVTDRVEDAIETLRRYVPDRLA